MDYTEIMREITSLKREHGKLITNIVPGSMKTNVEFELLKKGEGLIALAREPYRMRGYFAAKDEKALKNLLQELPGNIMFEWIYRDENIIDNIMETAGLSHYATYIRYMRVWRKNPYLIPAVGREALLRELYNPDFGEYATEEDAEELFQLAQSVFDVNCDDVFTMEEWKEIIARREVLVGRVGGKIVACYVWRLEKNKLYSNISINVSSADVLYNLERRIFTEMWDKGIRVFYHWKNMNNVKAMRRERTMEGELVESVDIIYNAIYKS